MWFTGLMVLIAVLMLFDGIRKKTVMLPTGRQVSFKEAPVRFALTIGFWCFWAFYFVAVYLWGDTGAVPA